MKVKMLSTRRGSKDGFEVRQYFKGEDYDLPEMLGCFFIWRGWAVNMDELEAQKKKNGLLTNPATLKEKSEN